MYANTSLRGTSDFFNFQLVLNDYANVSSSKKVQFCYGFYSARPFRYAVLFPLFFDCISVFLTETLFQ